MDHLKKETSAQKHEPVEEPVSEPTDLTLSRRDEANSALKLIRELPPAKQEVLHLRLIEEFSYREISEITGHSVSYVGVLVHEGVKAVREKLERTIGKSQRATYLRSPAVRKALLVLLICVGLAIALKGPVSEIIKDRLSAIGSAIGGFKPD
jgi:hypothetical protein